MNISFEYYKIFYFVAKYKNFTKAAVALNNNQPNVTRAINNLEHQLGCTLFIRSNKGAELTPEGEQLFSHVSIAIEQIQLGEEELNQKSSLTNGTISIGASETALHGFLLEKLQSFNKKFPGIRIKISNSSTPEGISFASSGLVDFSVVTTPCTVAKPLTLTNLKSFKEIVIVGPLYKNLAKKQLKLKDITKFPIVCLEQKTKTYEFYSNFFLSHNLILNPDIETATTDQILSVVEHNLGVGFIPEMIAKKALFSGDVFKVKIKEEIPERNICLIKDTSRPLSIASQKLLNFLTDK